MSRLNYHHLRYFHAVAHDGNLTRTAARLNLSQSALSVQIAKLEEQLGHSLFERRGRQLHLTEAGRIALDHADAIFAAGDELVGTLGNAAAGRQALRVGAMATLSRNFQIAFMRPLLGRSDVELVLRSGSPAELLQGLEALRLDLVLMNQPAAADAASAFISHRIDAQQVSLIGTPGLAAGASGLQALLERCPVILPTAASSIRTGFDSLLAREGVGLGVLAPIVVRDELRAGALVELAALPGITESFYAVALERRFPNPLVAELIAAAAEFSAGPPR
jgi:LysR family transcriptional activator of nhaA